MKTKSQISSPEITFFAIVKKNYKKVDITVFGSSPCFACFLTFEEVICPGFSKLVS